MKRPRPSLPRVLVLCALVAALTPLLTVNGASGGVVATPPWPHEFQGQPLAPVPLTPEERRLLTDFPGSVARFTDGERDFLMRWVTQPTRRLHSAEDCYRAWGYVVGTPRIQADRDGARWRCFEARRDGTSREICEQLRDTEGAHWTDVSAWYWSATLNRTTGPWLVTTVAARRAPAP